jgi:hypothetical protein
VKAVGYPASEFVVKPTVFRQFADFACSSKTRNCAKPQGVGCAGTARLAHELYNLFDNELSVIRQLF